jgi:hypothetical protein
LDERKLVEELRMHLAWRWFTGLVSIRRFRITPTRAKAFTPRLFQHPRLVTTTTLG